MADFDPQPMDDAATEAENDLISSYPEETIDQFATWWYEWFMTAGHKRLGRILVGIAKENKKKEG